MKTRWTGCGRRAQVASPAFSDRVAFAPVTDVRRTLTPQLRRMRRGAPPAASISAAGRNRLGGSALAQALRAPAYEAPDVDDAAAGESVLRRDSGAQCEGTAPCVPRSLRRRRIRDGLRDDVRRARSASRSTPDGLARRSAARRTVQRGSWARWCRWRSRGFAQVQCACPARVASPQRDRPGDEHARLSRARRRRHCRWTSTRGRCIAPGPRRRIRCNALRDNPRRAQAGVRPHPR